MSSRFFNIEMLVAPAPLMAAEQGSKYMVTAVSDVSCNLVQLRYAVFFMRAATTLAVAQYLGYVHHLVITPVKVSSLPSDDKACGGFFVFWYRTSLG